MKKIYILLIAIGLIICFNSCSDHLNVERYFNDRQSLERIFKSRDYTEEWLANGYFQLLNYNLEIGHVRFTVSNFSDDATFNEGGAFQKFKSGSYDMNYLNNSWKQSYDGIRQASIFIDNVDINEELTKDEIRDLKGQAYFLRGYLYWLLLRKYGPIPILPDHAIDYDASYDDLSYPRNAYDECVEYIAQQMSIAATMLELKRDTRSAARPTVGAALSVRAKVYLYAASPLFNGNEEMSDFTDDKGKILISQQYDNSKWGKAAAAALDVIELNTYQLYVATKRTVGSDAYPVTVSPPEHPLFSHADWPNGWKDIDPFESYRALFNGDLYVIENPELIFSRGDNQLDPEYGIKSLSRHQMPQFAGGYNSHGITGKQCDAYAMHDGAQFNRATSLKGFVTSEEAKDKVYPHLAAGVWKEYANREPRFYASVAFNGAVWALASSRESEYRNRQVWYYRGELEGRAANSERWQPTGIGMMKYVNPKDSYVNDGKDYPKVDIAIRYADILLMYAEALNEVQGSYQVSSWNGQKTHQITRNVSEMKRAIVPIRIRAGVPDYEQQVYEDSKLFQTTLKRERQIELFAENQRYYDLRRWKDAPKEEGEPIYGCNTFITKDNAEYFYEQVKVPHLVTTFSKRMYFWPIQLDELKRNKRLTQSPGWQTFD